MGCSIGQVQNVVNDSNSSFSFNDLQENEVSLHQIHEEIAFLKINIEKQKEIYPEEIITQENKWVQYYFNQLEISNKSDSNSKKSCLKQQILIPPLSQYHNHSKKVHFLQTQIQLRNSNSQKTRKKKKTKKKHTKQSKDVQQHIDLDEIF